MEKSRGLALTKKFPVSPGVYLFLSRKKEILYVGRATSLRVRVRSYFSGRDTRGERIAQMVARAASVTFRKTNTVLEAVIEEANLIKKHRPKYNIDQKDDKSFSYVIITKEEFPRIFIERETNLEKYGGSAKSFGPYTSKKSAEIVLKILRKIFPYHSSRQKTEKGCLYFQIGLCPGPYAAAVSPKEYKKNIFGITRVLSGGKKRLLASLKREMETLAKREQFEAAAAVRGKIFALQHIRDIALLANDQLTTFSRSDLDARSDLEKDLERVRIEGYDISHISGDSQAGSMVVFEGGEPKKSEYRKFTVKSVRDADDIGAMREVLARRLSHKEWALPDILLIDGGKAHLLLAQKVARDMIGKNDILFAALAKGPTRKKVELFFSDPRSPRIPDARVLVAVRDEAHRFALSHHRKLRARKFLYHP